MLKRIAFLLLSVFAPLQVQAASPIFQIRGTQTHAWYARAFGSAQNIVGTASVTSDVSSGIFGGSKIDMTTLNKGLGYMGAANWRNTANVTFLFRIIPTWTGAPSSAQALMIAANPTGDWFAGGEVIINTSGQLYALLRGADSTIYVNAAVGDALTFTSGTPTDIWLTCTSTTCKTYQAQNGNTAAQVGSSTTLSGTMVSQNSMGTSMSFGVGKLASAVNYYLNEADIWDSAEDPATYGTRVGFVTTSAAQFEGYAQTDPGIANVLAPGSGGPTNYVSAGVTLVGTFAPALPSAGDLRNGTVVSSVTGTLKVPTPGNVLSGVQTDATTGTYIGPSTGTVKTGTAYGAASALTGTYDGSDRWTDPGAANVLSGVHYKANATSNNQTGTLLSTDPGVDNVAQGTSYSINSTALVGTFTSLSTNPGISRVKIGTTYLINGTFLTGTYTGADRWSDPGSSNVSTGVTYLANTVTETGSRDVIQNEVRELKIMPDSNITDQIVLSRGDHIVLNLRAVSDVGQYFDLSSATFSTTFRGKAAPVTIGDSQHVAASNQSTDIGRFQLSLLASDTAKMKVGDSLEFVVTVTQVNQVSHFHGRITIKENKPVSLFLVPSADPALDFDRHAVAPRRKRGHEIFEAA